MAEDDDGDLASWVGYDPRSFGREPPFWGSFPEPLQVFLRDVHAGFASWDMMSFGPARPVDMETVADLAHSPDASPAGSATTVGDGTLDHQRRRSSYRDGS
ncbi:hypothetical protein JNW88_29980 [Micromonospora sp. ATA32]|nr:hypothetical protein [Micromonospora sp. ATA32]